MSDLATRLHDDLTTSMRARDELRTSTLRMVLAAVRTEEVAGKTARELSDTDVQAVLAREAKKRRESAEAFATNDRPELAERERAELGVIEGYLPSQLSDAELHDVVAAAIAEAGASQMGPAMKAATAAVAGRADGRRISTEVRAQLG